MAKSSSSTAALENSGAKRTLDDIPGFLVPGLLFDGIFLDLVPRLFFESVGHVVPGTLQPRQGLGDKAIESANHVMAQVDQAAILRQYLLFTHAIGGDDGPIPALKQASLDQINHLEDAFADGLTKFGRTLEQKDQRRVQDAWGKFISYAKVEQGESWNMAYGAAHNTIEIENLPEEMQECAVDLSTTVSAAVSTLINKQVQTVKKIGSSLSGGNDDVHVVIHDAQVADQTTADVTSECQIYEQDDDGGVSLADSQPETVSPSFIKGAAVDRVFLQRRAAGWQICGYE